MSKVIDTAVGLQSRFDRLRKSIDLVGPLLLRLYLVPVFWVAANNKWDPFADGGSLNPAAGLADTASWFGGSLGMPFPLLMALLAWAAEYFGAILLAVGLAVRWIAIPLLFTMLVAVTTVHWEHGWQAVHDGASPFAAQDVGEVMQRRNAGRSLLRQHGNYDWLTERGSFVISNNGIEWAATYFVMLLALFVTGGGRFISLDYWIARNYRHHSG